MSSNAFSDEDFSDSSLNFTHEGSEASDFGIDEDAERIEDAVLEGQVQEFGPYMFEPPAEDDLSGMDPDADEDLEWRLDHTTWLYHQNEMYQQKRLKNCQNIKI